MPLHRGRLLGVLIFFIVFIGLLYLAINVERKELSQQEELEEVDILNFPKSIQGTKKMILVPGSTFNFYIDETPVTYADFQKYVDAGGTKSKYWDYETYNQLENPITGIDWYHAVDFCNWRSETEGLTPAYKLTNKLDTWGYSLWELDDSATGYRLPTEAEFEYAARGGFVGKSFPWGDDFDSSFANYDNERGEMKGDWWRLTKVKDTPPNGYGLYGMSGNIWHWTNDWDDPDKTKTLKGGSWGSISPTNLEITNKSFSAPSNYNYDIGFRSVLPVRKEIKNLIENQNIPTKKITHNFYQYKTVHYENPLPIDVCSEEFLDRLTQFIADYYPNSIYFQTKIDKQEIISPEQMAELVIEVSKEYHIHPLFLAGIMTAESGFGSCSFPRWYNNPMAYHWQNALMKNGLPTYEADPSLNRKYKDLKSGFIAFARGIRKDIYLKAAEKNLNNFHLVYVGYQADEWMNTISKVYKDILGVRLEQNYPAQNVGKLIYTDWDFLF